MKHLSGLHILVLGLGDSGRAMARWCVRCGAASVTVADTRENPPQAEALREELPQVVMHLGGLPPTLLEDRQLVLKSPGLAPQDPQLRPLLEEAERRGLPVRGELSLFASALADLKTERGYAPKVLAITGTNGKTTTTNLTAQLVERCGLRVGLAGNIGPTLLDTLGAALDLEPAPSEAGEASEASAAPAPADAATEADVATDEATAPDAGAPEVPEASEAGEVGEVESAPATVEDSGLGDLPEEGGGPPPHLIPPPPPGPVFEHLPEVWVLELSSFQLDGVTNFEPTAATVLNITQDHLDWHGDMAAYAAAKARIFGRDAVMVINADDARVTALVPAPVPGKGRGAKPVVRRVVRFGLSAPAAHGDFGLSDEGGMAWLARALPMEEGVKRRKDEVDDLVVQRLMPADALRIRGRHNASNALAALALATAAGCPLAPMLYGLREYRGEPHRVEYLGQVQGVDAYDDSKGTNVGATVAAIDGLGPDLGSGRLIVILGGDGKGQDFTPLREPLARHARAVALIGRDAPGIAEVLEGLELTVQAHVDLESATRWCFEQAGVGDAVLLSPACASLDMFRNYAHRAQVFVETVQAIAADHGEALA